MEEKASDYTNVFGSLKALLSDLHGVETKLNRISRAFEAGPMWGYQRTSHYLF